MTSKVKGELKIEFYAHLGEIKDLYFNQGIRVFKILHQKMVEKHELTISYKMFCYYAKKEFKRDIKTKDKVITHEIINVDSVKSEPVITHPSFSKATMFNPHSSYIDEDRIIE